MGWVRPNYMGWAHLGWAEVSPTSFSLRGLGRHSSGLETMSSPLYTCYVNSGDGGWRRRRRGGSWPDCGSRRRSSLLELELLVLLQNEVVVHWGELFSMVACSRGCWGKGNLILFFSFCFFFLYFSFFLFVFRLFSLSLVCFFLVLVSVFVPRFLLSLFVFSFYFFVSFFHPFSLFFFCFVIPLTSWWGRYL